MQLPSVICKFLYFDDKNNVYSKRWHLKKKNNPINRKIIYINEPLPEIEAVIAEEAKKRDMIVSTQNCVVSVLVENGIFKPKFMRVNELEDLDRLNAIKRKQNCNNEKSDGQSEDNITSLPKEKQFFDKNNWKKNNEKQLWAQTQFFVFALTAMI